MAKESVAILKGRIDVSVFPYWILRNGSIWQNVLILLLLM